MRISNVELNNFGCIEHTSISFNSYTSIIGPNNSGKSTILSAIDTFFSSAPKIEKKHFFRHDETLVISISIEFSDITPAERATFGSAIIDEKMRVTRHFGGDYGTSGIYSVDALAFEPFKEFREENNGTAKRGIYARLRPEYGLPAASGDAMEDALRDWENSNRDRLVRIKTRGFFGAPNIASGKLKKKTSLRFIPAVADISSQTDNPKTSPVIQLIGDIRQQTLENQTEFVKLVEEANHHINEFIGKVEDGSIRSIGEEITSLLQSYYSDTQVAAELPPPNEIDVTFPPPTLLVRHRALMSGVESVGHGLQRAILFSVVQFLAQNQIQSDDEGKQGEFLEAASDIIILVEEPEIYQHPQKQRIIRTVLDRITAEFNKQTGIRIQAIICTHSEKFVDIREIDSIRIVRTAFNEDQYTTSVSDITLEELRDLIFEARGGHGHPLAMGRFAASMHVFSEAISEGFFADKVILVEGVDDAAVIEGAFKSAGIDPHAAGIAIIPVDGKTKLDKPLQCFRHLGIKTYCVFDNDSQNKDKRTEYNKLLQRICGEDNPVEFPIGAKAEYAALDGNLEIYLCQIAGEDHNTIRAQVSLDFGISDEEMTKSPATVSAYVQIARAKGLNFPLFDEIVEAVQSL